MKNSPSPPTAYLRIKHTTSYFRRVILRQLTSIPTFLLAPIAPLALDLPSRLHSDISVGLQNSHHQILHFPCFPLQTWTPHNTECEEHCRSYAVFAYSLYFSGMLPAPFRRLLTCSGCRLLFPSQSNSMLIARCPRITFLVYDSYHAYNVISLTFSSQTPSGKLR